MPNQSTIVGVIVEALRKCRPDLPLPTAQLEAEMIVRRLKDTDGP